MSVASNSFFSSFGISPERITDLNEAITEAQNAASAATSAAATATSGVLSLEVAATAANAAAATALQQVAAAATSAQGSIAASVAGATAALAADTSQAGTAASTATGAATTATQQATAAQNAASTAGTAAQQAITSAQQATSQGSLAVTNANAAAMSQAAAQASATAAANAAGKVNLPALNSPSTDHGMLRAVTGGSGYEFRVPAQVYLDIGVDAGITARSPTGYRNLLVNPGFKIARRGAWSASQLFVADRWLVDYAAGGARSASIVSASDADRAVIGENLTSYFSENFTGTTDAGAYERLVQRVENVRALAGQLVTLSFWYASSTPVGRIGCSIDQHLGSSNGGTYTIIQNQGVSFPATTSWQKATLMVTLPTMQGKTLGSDGNDCTQVNIWFSAGANSTTTAGSVGVQSGNVKIANVQLEIGTFATPFEVRPGSVEGSLCDRFYQGPLQIVNWVYGATAGSNYALTQSFLPMRTQPTLTVVSNYNSGITPNPSAVLANGSIAYFNGTITAAGAGYLNTVYTLSAEL